MDPSLTLINALRQASVDFIVIGGIAAITQGANYYTLDLDICYSRDRPNLFRLAGALAPFEPHLRGAPENLPFVLDATALHAGCNFTLTTTQGYLDLLGEVAGLGDYARVNEYADTLEVDSSPCRVLSLEGLILAKRAAGRPKDQGLILELETLLALRKKHGAEGP